MMPVYPLPDAVYRRFVQARAVMVLGDGTIYTFIKAIKHIIPRRRGGGQP